VLGDAVVAAALDDPERADLPEKVKVTLRLLTKVTKDHRALAAADLAPVLAAGVSRQAVIEALDVAWAFNVITRLADAFEFEVGPPSFFDAGARMLLGRGYK
jgi:alkylhydroperoxidase family enzyme